MSVTLHGWGRTSPGVSTVRHASSDAEIAATFESSRALVARGLGRSYGDAAQCAGGIVIEMTGLDGIGPIQGINENIRINGVHGVDRASI